MTEQKPLPWQAGGRGREGVIIQPISRQTDSNIELQEWYEKGGESEEEGENIRRWTTKWSPGSMNPASSDC